MCYYYSVSADLAADAYGDAIATARRYRAHAAIMQRIADALDGVYCTCKITARAAEVLADYAVKSVRYYNTDSTGSKCLYVTTADGDRIDIQLCKLPARRVDGAAIRQSAEYYRQRADAINGALPEFYAALQQYNAALAAVDIFSRKIAPVMRSCERAKNF